MASVKQVPTPSFKVLSAGAREAEIEELCEELGCRLPSAYAAFLRNSNGAECGPHDHKGDSLRILRTNEIASYNRDYGVWKYLPELLCFASDGGDHAFAFQRAANCEADQWRIVRIPLGALFASEILLVAQNFATWELDEFRYPIC